MKPAHPYYLIGRHFYRHYRARAKAIGIPAAVARMRKDGVPADLVTLILATPEPVRQPRQPGWLERMAARIFVSRKAEP